MRSYRNFRGRIVQITEALDTSDAVSNQILALDKMLTGMGLTSIIGSKWFISDLETRRIEFENLMITDDDIVILHYYGYSQYAVEFIKDLYCTKILIYHNITPHQYFEEGSDSFKLCEMGRTQLADIVKQFSLYWGDSQYNLDELIALGCSPVDCAVLPIIVSEPVSSAPASMTFRPQGHWLFVGRVAANKGHLDLVHLFAKVHADTPDLARRLTIVGGANPQDAYVRKVNAEIKRLDLQRQVTFTGKIADEARDVLFATSSFYVSLSEHEGFGVPLIEAPLHGLPVLALDRGAVGETMGMKFGVSVDICQLEQAIRKLAIDQEEYRDVVRGQRQNARRFLPEAVKATLCSLLDGLLPRANQFAKVSVVICTYNRRDYLDRCLDYLTYQSNGSFEVIVVNGPSDDGTNELLETYGDKIKIVSNPERNLSKSRNLGIEASDGDIIAFIDDDALPFDDWVETILNEYNGRPLTIAGLGGPAYYAGTFWFQAEDNGIDKDCQVKVNISSSEIGKNGWKRYNTGTNATFRRDQLVKIKGFDEQFDYFLDESELCYRLQERGNLIGYCPDLYVRHEFAQSHNRAGKFSYNWLTICKNTAYFIAAYSGRVGETLQSYVIERMERERVAPLDDAVRKGELDPHQRDTHVKAIRDGARQGLRDALSWPKTRTLTPVLGRFLPYGLHPSHLAVGRDIPALHICIVSKELPPFTGSGGVGTLYYNLGSELLLMGHHVTYVVPGGDDHIHRQGRLAVHFTKSLALDLPAMDSGVQNNLQWSVSALAQLAQIQRHRPIDIVDGALWDTETLAFSMIEPEKRPPLIVRLVTPYSVSAEVNQWNVPTATMTMFKMAEMQLIKNADAVIPISVSIARTIEKDYGIVPDRRWSQGYCGIAHWPFFDVNQDYDAFPELAALSKSQIADKRIILFVGRLERRKGIDLILEAAEDILNADADALLVIAGRDTGEWSDAFRSSLPKKLQSRIHLLGEVSEATREKLLAYAYCLVFPSRYESFGLVPLEAFVHGTPVVAANTAAIPEVVLDHECGLLFDADSSKSLAAMVIRLLADPDLRQRLSNGARDRVKKLSARNSAVHSIRVYKSALQKGPTLTSVPRQHL